MSETVVMLGVFNLRGDEIILILALVLILFGAKRLPDLAKGLAEGIRAFGEATDDTAHEAGRSAGGIYGKGAVQALTPKNTVAELYDPAVLQKDQEPRNRRRSLLQRALSIWMQKLRFVSRK